jgi:hypothetical protein
VLSKVLHLPLLKKLADTNTLAFFVSMSVANRKMFFVIKIMCRALFAPRKLLQSKPECLPPAMEQHIFDTNAGKQLS